MKILTIDPGSYSVKFLYSKIEKRYITLQHAQEVIISSQIKNFPEDTSLSAIQIAIIEKHLSEFHHDGKILIMLPQEFVSTRFLNLPVTSKKKAELMIPFQLEENLPLGLKDIHYTYELTKKDKETRVVINTVQKTLYDNLYNLMSEKNITPNIHTSETTVIQKYVLENSIIRPTCLLDIGHNTTKAYFIFNKEIQTIHTSYIGGKLIDDIISKTYNIAPTEASQYKHLNAFFLIEQQYNEVSADQRDFAILMKDIMQPLINDFRRWELGFRVKCNMRVDKVLLTGGTSKISNIDNFLTQNFSIEVTKIDLLNIPSKIRIEGDKNRFKNHEVAIIAAFSQISSTPVANFLSGEYSNNSDNGIPLHSTAFLFSRSLIISLLLAFFLVIENQLLNIQNKDLMNKISKSIQNSDQDISKKDQRKFKTNPEHLQNLLLKKGKSLDNEIVMIESTLNKDSLSSLAFLSQKIKKLDKVDMTKFSIKDSIVNASFTAQDTKSFENLKAVFESIALNGKNIDADPTNKEINLQYEDRL